MKFSKAKWYPAHSTNYTKGRGRSVKYFTVHHTAASNTTLRYLWGDPDRNGSSHFGVFKGYLEQYVDTNDTAWTNGNWTSNQESITAEVTGDWRFGYKDQKTLDQLTELMYWAIKNYKGIRLNYHKDVSKSPTVCPADLKDKGYARQCWDKALNRIALENKPQPAELRLDIPDKKVILIRDSNVWDMNFNEWKDAKAVARLKKGTVIDVAGEYDHPLSKVDYYLSKWSWDKGINNGISKGDVKDYIPETPPLEPEPPVVTPPQDRPETLPETPNGGQGPQEPEVMEMPNWFVQFLIEIIKFLSDIISKKEKENAEDTTTS